MTLREWTDPRDGWLWWIWLQSRLPPMMVFGLERDLHTVSGCWIKQNEVTDER
jgi:hypothetical protein